MSKKLIVFLALALFLVSGCAGLSKKDKSVSGPMMLEPNLNLRFNDIPVPAGFKSIPKDSYSFENNGIRVGLLKYRGRADADQVTNFYKEQMMMYNWNLLNIIEYGDRLLNFERDIETCVITLVPKGRNITIIISMGPKSQVPGKTQRAREEKLIK